MGGFVALIKKVSLWMNTVGGVVLFIMMMLTVVDVVVRIFGSPITGTYELVALAGAIVVGFAIPQTSQENGHIYVDFLLEKRSPIVKRAFACFTKTCGIILFALLAWYLFQKSNHLYAKGDVSLTLQIPYYPAAYALAFCALIECLVLVTHVMKTLAGGDENE